MGLASSGLHSNGYSLARKIVFDRAGLTPETFVPELGRTVADELLEPTRIYVARHEDRLSALPGEADRAWDRPHHGRRTGGQSAASPPRGMRHPVQARLLAGPQGLPLAMRLGSVDLGEMDRVFNMGIGLILVVAEYYAEAIVRHLNEEAQTPAWIIGEVIPGERNVVWDDSVDEISPR